MATLGHKVIGVDFRKYPYKHPNFRFKQADILSMPFPDDKFDIVTCISTLEHIGLGFYGDSTSRDSPDKKAILQITRTLKEGGLFLFSVPFGMKQKNSQQRIYDSDTINLLFKNFRILEKAFYKNFSGDELNYWDKISEEEAKKVYSKDGSTNCIILIKAKTRV
jgi:ubiquinone/menaquinone biosynthesis C-methylase UbiE